MKERIRKLFADPLFRNSFYLMLNTGVLAVLGFFFWFIASRLFTPDQVGVASSLISTMTFISYLSLLGFDITFIRFLPTSKNRNNEINTGLLLSIAAAVVIGTAYVLLVPFFAPDLLIIRTNIFYAIGFVVLIALAAINLLSDSIFIALRGAKYNLLIDGGIMGIIKLLLPFAFVGLGAYGLFAASGSAAAVAMIASITFLVVKFNYRPHGTVDGTALRNVFHYSFSNYIANLLNIAPTMILPIIVLDRLGSAQAGYYYLAFTVANLLYAVTYAVSASLLAEGSYGEVALKKLAKRSAWIIAAIMIPCGFILAILGPAVLHVFGKSYSDGGTQALVLFALAAPIVAIYTVGGVLLRIVGKMYSMIAVNIVYFLIICGLAAFWAEKGLMWVAIAWAIGNAVAGTLEFLFFIRKGKHHG